MERIIYLIYAIIGTVGYVILICLYPVLKRLNNRYGYRIRQRLGWHSGHVLPKRKNQKRIWLHASSVGEVQAAKRLVDALTSEISELQIIITTTTEQGHKLALNCMPANVYSMLAPLDIPFVVQRTLAVIQPDMYICLETELWPVMLTKLSKHQVTAALFNGRLSLRSFKRYMLIRGFMASLLKKFAFITAASEDDAGRFLGLGAERSRVAVYGNVKTAFRQKDITGKRKQYRALLQATGKKVFICGSTHTGEDELLIRVYQQLGERCSCLLVIAPRHLERVGEVAGLLSKKRLDFTLFSQIKDGGSQGADIILVDTMGDLAHLYSAGDFCFCGGSFVNHGGHNIMEILQWKRPVYYGPYMTDFSDVASKAEHAGCAFMVRDEHAFLEKLKEHESNPQAYEKACNCTGKMLKNNDVVERHVQLVRELLRKCRNT